MAEVATATGTAHPPPLLRRLQVGRGHVPTAAVTFKLALRLALLPGAAFVQSKRYCMTRWNSSACSNRCNASLYPWLAFPCLPRRPACCRSCLPLRSFQERTSGGAPALALASAHHAHCTRCPLYCCYTPHTPRADADALAPLPSPAPFLLPAGWRRPSWLPLCLAASSRQQSPQAEQQQQQQQQQQQATMVAATGATAAAATPGWCLWMRCRPAAAAAARRSRRCPQVGWGLSLLLGRRHLLLILPRLAANTQQQQQQQQEQQEQQQYLFASGSTPSPTLPHTPAPAHCCLPLPSCPAGDDAMLVVPCAPAALRRAAVAYLDRLVAKVLPVVLPAFTACCTARCTAAARILPAALRTACPLAPLPAAGLRACLLTDPFRCP
jgi:hypothetical protein